MDYKIPNKFTCRFCKEQFDLPKTLYKHLQQKHSAGATVTDNRTCPLCGVQCAKYEGYRDHLLYIHGQCSEGQKLTFKSLNDFLIWKTELEVKYNCKYILQSSPKVLPTSDKKYFYQCDRSESKEGKEKRINTVAKKTCPSMISVVETSFPNQQFKVEYWDTHSDHEVSSNSIPVQKDELAAAISSVEMVQAISDDDQSFEKMGDFSMSEDSNSALSKSLSENILNKKSTQSNNSVVSVTKGQPVKGSSSVSKTETVKKKGSTNSCLYSLASVACMKGISKPKENLKSTSSTKNATNNLKSPSVKATSSQSNSKSDNKKIIAESATKSKGKEESTASNSLACKISSVESLSVSQPSIVNAPLRNNNPFTGQVLLLNPVPGNQNALNSSQNVLSTGQNILLAWNPVTQTLGPLNQPVLSADQKMVVGAKSIPGDGNSSSKEVGSKKMTTAASKKKSPQSAVSVSKVVKSEVKTSTANITNFIPPPSSSSVTNPPVSTVLLSSLPVGSTFMSIGNNLIPVKNSPAAFLPPNLNSNIVLAPAVPSSSAFRQPLVSNISTVVTKPTFTSTKPITGSPQVAAYSPLLSSTPSTLANYVSNVIKTSPIVSPVVSSTPVRRVNSNVKTNIFSQILNTPKGVGVVKQMPKANITIPQVVETIRFPASVNSSSASPINAPALKTNAQKAGTLLVESSGDIYVLEPVEDKVPENKRSALKCLSTPPPKKIMRECMTQTPSSNFDGGQRSILNGKRSQSDDDSTVIQKVKYYQLEMKYLSCQEECKRLKLELTKAELKNKELLKDQKANSDSNKETHSEEKEEKSNETIAFMKELEQSFGDENSNIYTMARTSVLRDLYTEIEELSDENRRLYKELENYRSHDKFYKILKTKLDQEDF